MRKIVTELIPVIHMVSQEQVLTNIRTCHLNDVNKVFLIHHGCDNGELVRTAQLMKSIFPTMWIGVNLLGFSTDVALGIEDIVGLDGLWCDGTIDKEDYLRTRKFQGTFFGSLAFKYQRQTTDLETACKNAMETCDVATTSGEGTGKEISLVKLNRIKEYIGDFPLAIASGVSIDNIHHYVGNVDYLLVASSITDKNELIIPEKLMELFLSLNKLNSEL